MPEAPISRSELEAAIKRAVEAAVNHKVDSLVSKVEHLVMRADQNAANIAANTKEIAAMRDPEHTREVARQLIPQLGIVTVQSKAEGEALIELASERAAEKVLEKDRKERSEVFQAKWLPAAAVTTIATLLILLTTLALNLYLAFHSTNHPITGP